MMGALLLEEAARLRREQLLEEAAAGRLAEQTKDAERASQRFFGWIGAVWIERVNRRSHGRSVKGACCA
jgi:hypothetical protein